MVGYILWRDVGYVLLDVLRDPVARRFGLGIAIDLAFFFLAMTGYLFFPDPSIPFFLAISVGQLVVFATLSGLVGFDAAVIARYWRLQTTPGATQGS